MAVAKLPSVAESQLDALKSQAFLAIDLCDKVPRIVAAFERADQLREVQGHLYSVPDFGQILSGWSEMRDYGGSLSCELPTLQEAYRHVPAN